MGLTGNEASQYATVCCALDVNALRSDLKIISCCDTLVVWELSSYGDDWTDSKTYENCTYKK